MNRDWRMLGITNTRKEKLFCRYILPGKFGGCFFVVVVVVVVLMRLITQELAFSFRFGMAIWNDWKQKSSRHEVTHKSGNGTERYDWSAGLKHDHDWLWHSQQHRRKKRHTLNLLRAHFHAPTHAQDWKWTISGGGIVIWSQHSSIVQCPEA